MKHFTTKTGITIGIAHGQKPPEQEADLIDGEDPMREFEELCEWVESITPRLGLGIIAFGLVLGLVKGLLS